MSDGTSPAQQPVAEDYEAARVAFELGRAIPKRGRRIRLRQRRLTARN